MQYRVFLFLAIFPPYFDAFCDCASTPLSGIASDMIGFTSSGNVGTGGLEQSYNDVLNGTDGREYGYLNSDASFERTVKDFLTCFFYRFKLLRLLIRDSFCKNLIPTVFVIFQYIFCFCSIRQRFPKKMQKKLVMLFMAVVLAFVVLIGRITYINASNGEKYTRMVTSL